MYIGMMATLTLKGIPFLLLARWLLHLFAMDSPAKKQVQGASGTFHGTWRGLWSSCLVQCIHNTTTNDTRLEYIQLRNSLYVMSLSMTAQPLRKAFL
jgi:hypothetical protein